MRLRDPGLSQNIPVRPNDLGRFSPKAVASSVRRWDRWIASGSWNVARDSDVRTLALVGYTVGVFVLPLTSVFGLQLFGLKTHPVPTAWGVDPTGWQSDVLRYIGFLIYSSTMAFCFAAITLCYRSDKLREYRWLSFCGLLFFNIFTIILGVFGSIALFVHWSSGRDKEITVELIDDEYDEP